MKKFLIVLFIWAGIGFVPLQAFAQTAYNLGQGVNFPNTWTAIQTFNGDIVLGSWIKWGTNATPAKILGDSVNSWMGFYAGGSGGYGTQFEFKDNSGTTVFSIGKSGNTSYFPQTDLEMGSVKNIRIPNIKASSGLNYVCTDTNGTLTSQVGICSTLLTATQGGTGTAYFTVAGPTASRVYTFPDAAATILYSGGALGTPSSGSAANLTSFPTLNQNTTGTAANVTGTVAVANGGSGATTLTGVLKGNGTSAFTAATAGTDYVSPSSTETLTNKTLSAEGTGNVLTVPFTWWLPAAGCNNATAGPIWDLPTSTPAVAACVTGTNTQKGVLQYADTSGGFSAQITQYLPADWTSTSTVDVDLLWTTTATTGNAKWTVQFVCTDVAASATDDPAFPSSGNGFNTVTTAAPGTASRVQVSTITGATLPSSCVTATRELLHVRLFRDGNDAADTIAATANFIGMNLTYRRAM